MSDLTATNCGCQMTYGNNNGCCGSGNFIWILLLLSMCGGNGNCGFGSIFGGRNCGNDCDNNSYGFGSDWIIWILLLSCFCGNNSCGCN